MTSFKNGKLLYKTVNDLFEMDPLMYVRCCQYECCFYEYRTKPTFWTMCREELGLILSTKPREIGCEVEHSRNTLTDENVSKAFFLRDHKLGVSYWCIPDLFSYTREKLFSLIHSKNDSGLDYSAGAWIEIISLTRCLLLINPEYNVAWNLRKEAIKKRLLTLVEELRYLDIVFSKHHKSMEAWFHRKWVISRMEGVSRQLFDNEIQIYERVAEMYPKNYLAWTQRRYLVDRYCTVGEVPREMKAIKKWISRHISDNSAHHHLRYLISLVLRNIFPNNNPMCSLELSKDSSSGLEHGIDMFINIGTEPSLEKVSEVNFVLQELKENSEMIVEYPGHETLWFHRDGSSDYYC